MSVSKTTTSTNTSVSQLGDVITVKTTVTTTKTEPGKTPDVKVEEKTEKFEGKDAWDKLPEDLRKALEKQDKIDPSKINMKATKGDFVNECLKIHNKYREKHGVDSLKLSKELVKYSEERAKELAEKDDLEAKQSKYGENVTVLSSSNPEHAVSAEDVCARWYSEHEKYNFKEEPKTMAAGHFTQMIWKNTKEIGVAAVKSKTNKIYVVASYDPSGNYVDQFKENVPAPKVLKGVRESVKELLGRKKEASDSSSCDEDTDDELNKESVKVHNSYRKKHGVAPLKYSKELRRYAQEWADKLARTDKMEHRTEGKYGENLYFSYSSDPHHLASARDACDSWYSEIKDHKFGQEPRSMGTGHFTQMIWKGSKEVGMGRSKSRTGKQYIVANYSPQGNFVGRFAENVPKPK